MQSWNYLFIIMYTLSSKFSQFWANFTFRLEYSLSICHQFQMKNFHKRSHFELNVFINCIVTTITQCVIANYINRCRCPTSNVHLTQEVFVILCGIFIFMAVSSAKIMMDSRMRKATSIHFHVYDWKENTKSTFPHKYVTFHIWVLQFWNKAEFFIPKHWFL